MSQVVMIGEKTESESRRGRRESEEGRENRRKKRKEIEDVIETNYCFGMWQGLGDRI